MITGSISRTPAASTGAGGLRLARSTSNQLTVAWDRQPEVAFWLVTCWDSRDVAVARLRLPVEHRRATVAGLAKLPQPFAIGVSGIGEDGAVLWQGGLDELRLKARPTGARERSFVGERAAKRRPPGTGKGGAMATKKGKKKAPDAAKSAAKPKPKKKTSRGK